MVNKKYVNRTAFAVGTGRCGTNFVYKLLANEAGIASFHEKNIFAECFHRYAQWYELPIDERAFLQTKQLDIAKGLMHNEFYFEASAPLSHSIDSLYEAFGSKFILLIRDPIKVVDSYLKKGWYELPIDVDDIDKAPGYNSNHLRSHHSFSRIAPRGEHFVTWNRLGRPGKLGWYWAATNQTILESFDRIPKENSLVFRLEDYTYDSYLEMLDFLSRKPSIDRNTFESIVRSKPNHSPDKASAFLWTENDWDEFVSQVESLSYRFGYSLDKPKFIGVQRAKERVRTDWMPSIFSRYRNALRKAKSAFVKELSKEAISE